MKNQKGLTLIEVLATLTILSIVGIVIWGGFIQGTKYSNTVMTKNQLIQEANLVIANLKNIHRTADTIEIQVNDCNLIIKNRKGSNEETITFEHPNICYSIQNLDEISSPAPNPVTLNLLLTDKNNTENKFDIHVYLYRLE